MMKRLALLVLLLAAVAARGDDFSKSVAAMENAWLRDDAAALSDSIQALQKLPPSPRVAYAIGYAERRLSHIPTVPAPDRSAAIADAAARFEEVIKAEPKNGEAHALLASCLGWMIGFDKSRGMELGPRASGESQKALMLEPNNPRVLLLAGTSTLMTPEEYGGGAEKAEPLLRRAVSLFTQEPADRPWPNWGRFESHIWLGQLLDKAGKRDAARSEYEAALAIAPHSHWARAKLEPRSK